MPVSLKDYLVQLKELQTLDTRIRQVELELNAIPSQLETSGAEYFELQSTLQEKEASLKAMTQERQTLEAGLKESIEQVTQREKRLYSIKTQKEYQATLKEVAQMKKENKDREERVLKLLEEGEKLTSEITQLKSEIADKEGGFRQIETELKTKEETLGKERETLKERRPVLLTELPSETLKKYDFIKRRYTDAVAAVKKGICQGCNMNIPPQFYNEMLKSLDLKNCPNCHRLIYVDTNGTSERES